LSEIENNYIIGPVVTAMGFKLINILYIDFKVGPFIKLNSLLVQLKSKVFALDGNLIMSC